MLQIKFAPQGITLTPAKNTDLGNQIQARAWADANSSVVDHISLMVTMHDYRKQLVHLNLRSRLSVADAVVLELRLD